MIKPEPTEWVLPLYSRNGKYVHGELRVCVNIMAIHERVEKTKEQNLMIDKDLKEQLEQSNKNSMENYNELQGVVEERDLKLQQTERSEENGISELEEEYHVSLEMKQAKISDQEKYRMKLSELERKHKEMLEFKKECEIAVEQKKLKVAELREEYERKIHELKLVNTSKEHDEKKIEENYQKIIGEVVEDLTAIQKKVNYICNNIYLINNNITSIIVHKIVTESVKLSIYTGTWVCTFLKMCSNQLKIIFHATYINSLCF